MREAAQLADLRIVHMGDRQRQHVLDMEPEVNRLQASNAVVNSSNRAPCNPVYEVELILDKREVEGVTQYLVMWRGWPDGTWEPVENLKGSERLVKKFEKVQKSTNGLMSNGSSGSGEKRGRDRSDDRKRVKKLREASEESESSGNGSKTPEESETSEPGSTESRDSEEELTRQEIISGNCMDTPERNIIADGDETIKENGQVFTETVDKVNSDEAEKEEDDILTTDKKEKEEDPEEEKDEEEEWEVEKVLKKRKVDGVTNYFVKWVGWEEV